MLEIKNLCKSYNENIVLENISLNIQSGSIVGIVGTNGAGKTTLLNSISGNHDFKGEIKIDSMSIFEFINLNRNKILYVRDNPFVYDFLTGFEFVRFIIDIQKTLYESVEKKMFLLFKLFNLEEQMNYLIKDYSRGMKRKISLIAALVQSPKLLLLDEPASGLDTTSIISLKRFLVSMAKNGTIIVLTTHIIDLVENLCDTFVVLHDKKIALEQNIIGISKYEIEKMYIDYVGSEIISIIDELIDVNC